jgi:type IV pilus assembly protein PilW
MQYKGFTLIELMIAMAIGLLLVAAVITLYVSMSGSNIDYLKSVRLNHELRSTMSQMVRDIRRAGHNQDAATESVAASSINPFSNSSASTVQATVLTVSGTSTADRTIRFSYDSDDDTNVDTFGYRLNVASGVGTVQYCSDDSTTNGTACTGWEGLTDSDLVDIDSLEFELDTITVASGTLTIRQVTITLTGKLISDSDFTRTITEVVKIRNDHSPNWAM